LSKAFRALSGANAGGAALFRGDKIMTAIAHNITANLQAKTDWVRREIAGLEHDLHAIDRQIDELNAEREEIEEQLGDAREELAEITGEDAEDEQQLNWRCPAPMPAAPSFTRRKDHEDGNP
jgi:septal ring factor EnvC (AmiA/AmiB activator)